MKWSWRTELPQWALIAGMFLLAAISWSWAPERIPVHWNVAGQVDRYGGKVEGLLMPPALALGIYLLLLLAPRIDPGRKNYALFSGAYAAIRVGVLALLSCLYGLTHLVLRGHTVDIATAAPLAVGGLLVIIGNLMGKIRPNWFVGIRTPWTLSSKEAWVKTHRLGGWLFIVTGLGLLLTSILRATWAAAACIGLLLVSVLVTYVYSYLAWRDDPDKIPPAGTLPGP